MTIFKTADTTNVAGTAVDAAGEFVYISEAAHIVGLTGIFSNSNLSFDNYGSIWGASYGVNGGIGLSNSATYNYITNELGATIGSTSIGISCAGNSTIVNFGSITSSYSPAIRDNSQSSGWGVTLQNFGTIGANFSYAYQGTQGTDRIYNSGLMYGGIYLGTGAGGLVDSTLGTITGIINISSTGGGTAIGGQSGNQIYGASGNDVFYANPTQQAADNHAWFLLSGFGGNNALYGSGAYTTFYVGASNGGTNQVWGGLSMMGDVSGYLNNTVSFAMASKGVYVDLLSGHNAFVNDSAGAWDGSGVFEDWIQNVPNVLGSLYGDVIQADGTGGKITGSGGADSLYGATGADTFAYTAYADSNTVNGYDTVVNFQRGTDKIDISGFMSAFGLNAASLTLFGSGNSTTVYVERVAGTFNAATDLAFVVNSTGGTLSASDFIL